ncbi:MAG TPA: SRPBCC domain-containing protein [Bacteroidota bacterium]|nr:SRPBCC domain-containing protein [Bacteroidota bacterium]
MKISSQEKKSSKSRQVHPTTTIRQSRYIGVSPADLYDAYLDDKTHSRFTGARATCERYVGGKFTAWNGYISGKNVKLENGRRIIQEWMTTEWPAGYGPSLLEFTFHAKGSGTEVRIKQSNVPAVQAKYYQKGWDEFYWRPMKNFFKKNRSPH